MWHPEIPHPDPNSSAQYLLQCVMEMTYFRALADLDDSEIRKFGLKHGLGITWRGISGLFCVDFVVTLKLAP